VDEKSILGLLDGESRKVQDLKENVSMLKDFLELVKKIDSLPAMDRRSHEESRSLYEAVSNGRDVNTMDKQLEGFFGTPCKPLGESMPLRLRFSPSVKYLGGARKDQSLSIKKLKSGEFYAALWPWQNSPETMTVHLGYCCNKMSDEDYSKLEKLVEEVLAEPQLGNSR
jgi:hypothetical protein